MTWATVYCRSLVDRVQSVTPECCHIGHMLLVMPTISVKEELKLRH